MSDKNIHKVQKTVLDLFWKLAQKNSSERIQSSVAIINVLCIKQNEAQNEKEMCDDLKYCVERLVKGLASPREAARLGYTLVLTEILRQFEVVQIDKILELVKQHLSVTSKQEKRDATFGQVFVYSALVRSGRLKEDSHLPVVVTSIFHLSTGKSYILRACYEVFLDLFSQVSEENFTANVWPILKKDFSCGWENCTTDVLWLLFLCIRMFPNAVSLKFLKKKWGNEDIFSNESIDYIKNLMKQTTNVLPMVHPLCSEFVYLILERKDFKEIWLQIVDENLFESEQVEKTFVGFEMIKAVLQNSTQKKIVEYILSAKFCQVFTSSFMNAKHMINPAAIQLAEHFCEYVKNCKDPESQVIILKALLLTPEGMFNYQVLKKGKISIIISHLLSDAVKEFSEMLKSTILGKSLNSLDADDETENRRRVQAASQIAAVISHPATILDFDWRLDTIKFLFLHSLFSVTKPNTEILHCAELNDPLPATVRCACGGSFTKALDSLYRWTEGTTALLSQYLQFLLNIFEYADQLIQATSNVTPLFELEKVKESWLNMKESVTKLTNQSKKDGVSNESNAFQILFLQLGMQLLFGTEQISDTIEELQICCDKARKTFKNSDKNVSEDSEEPPWISVVVDILLSLLSGQSAHMRRLISAVFPPFCPFITNEALQQILDVINPSKTTEEDMLVDESDAENEDNEKDVEFESGSSSDEGDDSNKNDEMQIDEDFKQKIRQALGPAAEDSDSESEVVLSDSDMFKLDDAISKAFLMRKKSGHTQLSLEDKTLLNFRIRCLDLIIAYLKSEPPLKMALQCIQPVLTAYEYGNQGRHQSPLFVKAVSALKCLTNVKSFQHCNDVQISEIETLLDTIIEKCHRESNLAVSNKLHSLCIFIIRCFDKLKGIPSSNEKQHLNGKKPMYISKYISTLETFVKQTNSHMAPHFFVSLMGLHPEFSWHFMKPLREYAFDNTNRIYKKTQCLGLLLEVLKFSKNQETVTLQHWLEFGNQTIPPAVEIVVSAINNSDIKPLYITELLDVIFTGSEIVKEKSNENLLEKHSELLTCFTNMTSEQVKQLSKKGKLFMKKIMMSFGVKISKFGITDKTMKESTKAKKRELKLEMKRMNKKKRLSSESSSQKRNLNVGLENGDTDSS